MGQASCCSRKSLENVVIPRAALKEVSTVHPSNPQQIEVQSQQLNCNTPKNVMAPENQNSFGNEKQDNSTRLEIKVLQGLTFNPAKVSIDCSISGLSKSKKKLQLQHASFSKKLGTFTDLLNEGDTVQIASCTNFSDEAVIRRAKQMKRMNIFEKIKHLNSPPKIEEGPSIAHQLQDSSIFNPGIEAENVNATAQHDSSKMPRKGTRFRTLNPKTAVELQKSNIWNSKAKCGLKLQSPSRRKVSEAFPEVKSLQLPRVRAFKPILGGNQLPSTAENEADMKLANRFEKSSEAIKRPIISLEMKNKDQERRIQRCDNLSSRKSQAAPNQLHGFQLLGKENALSNPPQKPIIALSQTSLSFKAGVLLSADQSSPINATLQRHQARCPDKTDSNKTAKNLQLFPGEPVREVDLSYFTPVNCLRKETDKFLQDSPQSRSLNLYSTPN